MKYSSTDAYIFLYSYIAYLLRVASNIAWYSALLSKTIRMKIIEVINFISQPHNLDSYSNVIHLIYVNFALFAEVVSTE